MKSKFLALVLLCYSNHLLAEKELTLQPGPEAGKDAWVWSFEPAREVNFGEKSDNNYGLSNVIRAEVWKWGGKKEPDTIRGFLEFDLSDISQKTSVFEAKLSLYFYANEGFTPQLGDNELVIQRVATPWDETEINWNNQPKGIEHNQIILPASVNTEQNYIDIDVRNLVQEMVYFPENNYGFLLKLKNEVEFNGLTFASSEHENEQLRPKLYIKYLSFD